MVFDEIKKWLNHNTSFPLGNIVCEVVMNIESSGNLIDFISNCMDQINCKFLLFNIKDLNYDEINNLPKWVLAFNTQDNVIDSDSVKHIFVNPESLKKYQYIVLFEKCNLKIHNTIFKYITISRNYIFIMFLFFAFLASHLFISFSVFHFILGLINFIALFLVYKLYSNNISKTISDFCKLTSKNEEENCTKLKNLEIKIFGLLDFNLVALYFITITNVFWICLVLTKSELFFYCLLILYLMGSIMSLHSFKIQFSNKLLCSICIFTIISIFINSVYLYYQLVQFNLELVVFNKEHYYFYLFITVLISLIILLFQMSVDEELKNRKLYLKERNNFLKMYMPNSSLLWNTFKKTEGSIELKELSIKSLNYNEFNTDIIVVIGLECSACKKLVNSINQLIRDGFNIHLNFYLLSKSNSIKKNEKLKISSILALLYKNNNYLEFVNYYVKTAEENLNYSELLLILGRKNICFTEIEIIEMQKIIENQNLIIRKVNNKSYPIIISNNTIVPNYFPFEIYKYVL